MSRRTRDILRSLGFLAAAAVLGLVHSTASPIRMTLEGDVGSEGEFTAKGPPYITVSWAHRLFKSGTCSFIDASEAKDFESAHIPGARSLTPEAFDVDAVPALLDTIPRESTLVLYCGSGCGAADYVAIRVRELGFEKVLVIGEGLDAWRAAGHPVEAR